MKFIAIVLTIVAIQCIYVISYADDNWENRKAVSINLSRDEEFDGLHGEVIAEGYATQYLSYGAGFSFLLSAETGLHGGIEGRMRCSMPWGVSPFVGAGIFWGRWSFNETTDDEGDDNNGTLYFVEDGEKKEVQDILIAVYPEAGVYLWITDTVRLEGGVRYYITSKGRDSDRFLYGAGIAFAF